MSTHLGGYAEGSKKKNEIKIHMGHKERLAGTLSSI